MEKSKTKVSINNGWINMIAKPTIGKTMCLLLALTFLPFLSACSTAEKQEPTWNDMYEVRSYQVETITNEIITTVFICRQTETNKLVSVEKEEVDFGGYEFQPIEEAPKGEIELQCVDGSCEVK